MLNFNDVFNHYGPERAPFLHQYYSAVQKTRPYTGLRVAHNVPVVPNTLMKIACLVAGGAEVVVTNPSFMTAHPTALQVLHNEGVRFEADHNKLADEPFDVVLDTNAELATLITPSLGTIELTRSGTKRYHDTDVPYPVISIDDSGLKQIETCLGTGDGIVRALNKFAKQAFDTAQTIMVLGYGKVGRGITRALARTGKKIIVVDVSPEQHAKALADGYTAISGHNETTLAKAMYAADIVVTATGVHNTLNASAVDLAALGSALLVNAGVDHEIAPELMDNAIHNGMPVNFMLDEPTRTEYIDPILYAHTVAIEHLQHGKLECGLQPLNNAFDHECLSQWTQYHPNLAKEAQTLFNQE